ncbi:MAG: hypothetical protein MR779_03365 [Tenericutes bacterium]|nr:hypothetical protein [Mycoplasmatota bacterium]
MKICDFKNNELKKAVKMCLLCSLVLAYFIYNGFHRMYDVIFPVVFIYLIIKFYSIED